MYCKLNQGDHPYRVKSEGSRVIHAARDRVKPTRMAAENAHTACGLYASTGTGWTMLRDRPTITCKLCQKALGIIQAPVTNKRFIVYDTTTELYFKRVKYSGDWVKELHDAARWRTEEAAEHVIESIFVSRFFAEERSVSLTERGKQTISEYQDKHGCKLKVRGVKLWLELVD